MAHAIVCYLCSRQIFLDPVSSSEVSCSPPKSARILQISYLFWARAYAIVRYFKLVLSAVFLGGSGGRGSGVADNGVGRRPGAGGPLMAAVDGPGPVMAAIFCLPGQVMIAVLGPPLPQVVRP